MQISLNLKNVHIMGDTKCWFISANAGDSIRTVWPENNVNQRGREARYTIRFHSLTYTWHRTELKITVCQSLKIFIIYHLWILNKKKYASFIMVLLMMVLLLVHSVFSKIYCSLWLAESSNSAFWLIVAYVYRSISLI